MSIISGNSRLSAGAPGGQPTREQSRRAVITWSSIIVGLLVLQIGLCVVGVIFATRTNPPVVKDYYSKAVHWDQRNQSPAGGGAGGKATGVAGAEARP